MYTMSRHARVCDGLVDNKPLCRFKTNLQYASFIGTYLVTSRSYDITAIFAGIGGLELGLHEAGHRTSHFCEFDPEAGSVLAARFPGIGISRDVRETDQVVERIAKRSDLLTAGFPCTDLSQAGLTRGFAGGRSSLIRETLEIIRRRPFANVLIENVPNWRHLHRGAYLAEVTSELQRLGYRWAYRTVDARAFGLPQRRKRIFLFASLEIDPRDVLFGGDETASTAVFALNEAAHGFYWTEGSRGLGWGEDCVPTLKGGSSIGIPAPPAIVLPDLSVVTPDIADGERLQGFEPGWTEIEALSGHLGGGKFNQRKRWLLVGNAVNVRVSKWIGSKLARPSRYDGAEGAPLAAGESWPEAAWFDGSTKRKVVLGDHPIRLAAEPLKAFLRYPVRPLSQRATAGFHARASASRLRFVAGFMAAIERHLRRMESVGKKVFQVGQGEEAARTS